MKKLLAFSALTLAFSVPAFAGDVAGGPDGKPGPRHHKGMMFEKLDTDGNGEVTKAEFQAFHDKKFAEMDADGNGVVTKAEAEAAHEKMREKMKEHRKKRMEEGKGDHAPPQPPPAGDEAPE